MFLAEEDLPDTLRPGIVGHMVGVHQSVRQFSAKFEQQLRRHNYVTVGGHGVRAFVAGVHLSWLVCGEVGAGVNCTAALILLAHEKAKIGRGSGEP